MIVFGYEMDRGMGPLGARPWRLIITSDDKNNVLAWRGYNTNVEIYSADRSVIRDIEETISSQEKLWTIDRLEEEFAMAYDIPEYSFFFSDNNMQCKFLHGCMFRYKRHTNYPNTDIVFDLVLQIQTILQKNGLDIEIWNKEFLSYKEADNSN